VELIVIGAVAAGAWVYCVFLRRDVAADIERVPNSALAAGVWIALILAVIIGIQALYSISNPGRCLSGGGDRALGSYCDEWESGDSGWWFLP
jgi:hypothetical protein